MKSERPYIERKFILNKYIIDEKDFNQRFEIVKDSYLEIRYSAGNTQTEFSLITFEENPNLGEVGSEPPSESINKQQKIFEALDYCITYFTGNSVSMSFKKEELPKSVNDNYLRKYEEYMKQMGKQPKYNLSKESFCSIDIKSPIKLSTIEKIIKYSIECLNNESKKDLLEYYARGVNFEEGRFGYWYKCLEVLDRNKIICMKKGEEKILVPLDKIDLEYLGIYPQLSRHDKSGKRRKIKANYKSEFNSLKDAIETYRKNLRPLIDYFIINGKGPHI